jgi:predicted Fe-Mo cluster-binding NifX family protein
LARWLLGPVFMKAAIAYWQSRVSPVFDVADRLFLITIEDSREVHRESLRLTSRDPFERARKLAERGVDVLLCGAVSHGLEKALVAAGIRVLGFLGGKLESIVSAFINGQLNDGRLPRADRSGRRPHFEKRPGEEKRQIPPVHAPGIRR